MNERTDSAYWDEFWQASRAGIKPLLENDPQFGRRGIFTRMVAERLGPMDGVTVVEVGGGGLNFRLLALCRWLGARVRVVDYSPEALQIVEELFRVNDESVELVEADMLRPHAELPTADVVTHWGVLEHFQDPVPMLEACREILRPGGRMLFTMPNMLAWVAPIWREKAPENWATHVLHEDADLEVACTRADFELQSRFYAGMPFLSDTSWEWSGPVARTLALTQRALGLSARVLPVDRIRGRRLSKDRGFYAVARERADG